MVHNFRGSAADVIHPTYPLHLIVLFDLFIHAITLCHLLYETKKHTLALNVPDIDTYLGLMHTLFALEDIYGLKIDKLDGEVCLHLDKNRESTNVSLYDRFTAWQKEAEKYRNGEISKEEYDRWRYTYPEVEVQHTRDALDELKKRGIE